MSAYLISYDLDKPGQDYGKLIDAIKKFTGAKLLFSGWLVSTAWTSQQVYDYLAPFIDRNDRLFIVQLTGVANWWNVMASNETVKQLLSA